MCRDHSEGASNANVDGKTAERPTVAPPPINSIPSHAREEKTQAIQGQCCTLRFSPELRECYANDTDLTQRAPACEVFVTRRQ